MQRMIKFQSIYDKCFDMKIIQMSTILLLMYITICHAVLLTKNVHLQV